ncbi:S-adenosyl-L-methionine-dependent methyltransferase [Linnemannia elongata AG-77]|uniref:S-adenosyl-L-methionine-dependent methyltransferase n=1 Tax=Linnemannia elongata AG-77 TaxID=1314771 RepID=A0A197K1J2_9FUNG|nr:S-adenosyl-L-methionine-dependent methyltransferase [Linnemannia elongata AG-77]
MCFLFYFIFLTHISQKGQHALWKYIGGGNSHAPLRYDIDRILDSGCGLGEWTMEMAKEFPNATVYGIDINPELFPSVHQAVPSNCLFSPSNLLTRLSFPDQYFDFVYQRFLYLGLTVEDWPVALKELRRVMKPGGWIELFEPCMRVHRAGTRTREVMRWCSRLLQEERGLDFDFAGEKMKRLCESPEIGFHNVKLERLSIPVGAWGGRVGQAMAENMVLIFQTLQSALVPAEMTPSLDGSSMKAFDLMVQSWIRECEENKSYIDYYILVGQKPFEKEA